MHNKETNKTYYCSLTSPKLSNNEAVLTQQLIVPNKNNFNTHNFKMCEPFIFRITLEMTQDLEIDIGSREVIHNFSFLLISMPSKHEECPHSLV